MGTHDPAIVPISPTLSHGVTHSPTDNSQTRSDLEAQTNRPDRPCHTSKKACTHPAAPVASQSRDYAAPGGDFSADSDSRAGASAAGSAGGSAPLVDSNALTMMLRSNKRLRAEDVVESTIPAKRLRRCNDDCRREGHNVPNSSSSSSSSSSSCNNMCASTSRLSKWQSPRTSPLGPKSSTYRRRSRESLQPSRGPSKANPTFKWSCILRNFYLDNMKRNPYDQSAQWCQDLLLAGLKDCLHPRYECLHLYHPDEPGYDEEWPDESWSDEEWSDGEESEETLTPSDENHDQVEAEAQSGATQLRIATPKEPSQAGSGTSATFTLVHWSNWGNRLSSKSIIFNSALPWDIPESDSASTDENGRHEGAISEPTADIAAAA